MRYTIKAYKPNSDDYCMGCYMASYESDCIEKYNLSEDELIKEIANIEAIELRHNEEGYDIEYFIYQPTPSIPSEKRDEIDDKVKLLIEDTKVKRKEEKEKLAEEEKRKQLERTKQQELVKLEELKEKYE